MSQMITILIFKLVYIPYYFVWTRYNRQMSLESRRGSTILRQVLKEISVDDQNGQSTRRGQNFESVKLIQAVSFLQKKIDRQHSQIKILSEQLSKEISMKEELLRALNEQKEKGNKLAQHFTALNSTNNELRKKLAKVESNNTKRDVKDDFQIKLNKYRQIVKKKDQFIFKTQQRLDDVLKNQRNAIQLEHQLKSLRESFGRLKNREEMLTVEAQNSKRKYNQCNQKLKINLESLKEKQQRYLFSEEHLKRLKIEFEDQSKQFQIDQIQSKNIQKEMKQLLERQNEQIRRLTKLTEKQQIPQISKPEWQLSVFKNQIKRTLSSMVKDTNLKKKIEKEMIDILADIQHSFANILSNIFGNNEQWVS